MVVRSNVSASRASGKVDPERSGSDYPLTGLILMLFRQNEAGARVWIDAFLFRASAMVPPGYRMVFNTEQNIPAPAIQPSSLATISGFADYTIVVAKDEVAGQSYRCCVVLCPYPTSRCIL